MTKRYRNPPPPDNYTKPTPPPCPPPPPSREFICNIFGFNESKESINKREQYMKNKEEGIPYSIIGNGVMVADAEDVRKYAKHQFDKCNEYSNKQRETQTINQHTNNLLKEAIKLCEDYSNDRYNLYKGRSPYKGNEEGRADNYIEGQSAGAELC